MFTNFNEVSNHIESNHTEAVVKVVKCFECKKELPKDGLGTYHVVLRTHKLSSIRGLLLSLISELVLHQYLSKDDVGETFNYSKCNK